MHHASAAAPPAAPSRTTYHHPNHDACSFDPSLPMQCTTKRESSLCNGALIDFPLASLSPLKIFSLAPMSRAYDSSEGRVDGPNPSASDESVPLLIDARRAQMCTFAEISGKRRDAETPGFVECEFPGWFWIPKRCVMRARTDQHRHFRMERSGVFDFQDTGSC
jgi:hypothetical protein